MKSILVLDMSYTLAMVRERQLEQALASRTLGGYFERVISVHPLAGLHERGPARFGKPVVTGLSNSHAFVEGRVGRFSALRLLSPVNFALAQISLVRAVLKMARAAGVDIVRIGDPYYLGLLGLFISWRLGVPLAIRVAGRYEEIYRATGRPIMPRLFVFRQLERIVERQVFPRCDLIAGANEDNMRYALENGGRAEVATVFRYGNLIHPDHWAEPALRTGADPLLAELGLDDTTHFVATVARLEKIKHVEDVIQAVALLVRRGHDIKALLIGDGALREDLERLARELQISPNVVFAGNRPQKWIAAVLPRAAAIASPQMGRALTEAALAAVPIVAYDYDWQREVVVDGQTGYLVPYRDWEALAIGLERLLNDSHAKEMGLNARRNMLHMMDPERLERHEQMEYSRLFDRLERSALEKGTNKAAT